MVVGRELAEALSDCDEALKLQPDNVQTRETRGFVFLKLGETDKAAARALMPDVDRQFASFGVK